MQPTAFPELAEGARAVGKPGKKGTESRQGRQKDSLRTTEARVERAPSPAAFDFDFDLVCVERTLPSVASDLDLDVAHPAKLLGGTALPALR